MKIGICNEMFEGWKFEEICSFISKVGYEGIEIAPFTFADSVDEISKKERERIREIAKENNLEIIGTHWLLVKPEGLSVSSPDREIREKTARYLKKLVVFTHDIGGELMVFGSPKQRNIQEGQSYGEVKEYFKEVLNVALEECEKRNVFICLEPLARKETNFITTARDAIEIIEEVGHPNLKLHLDVKAMCDEERPITEIIKEGAKHLFHFHTNDKNLLGPGFGDVDFEPIISTLKEIGYNRWLSVEVFDFSPGPENIATKSIEYLRKFV